MNIFYKNKSILIVIVIVILIIILISNIIILKRDNKQIITELNNSKHTVLLLNEKNVEIVDENKKLIKKYSILKNQLENNQYLSKFFKKSIYLDEVEFTTNFLLKNKNIDNFSWYYDKNCLQPKWYDNCNLVEIWEYYDITTRKCKEIQTWWCSPWLNYWSKWCKKSCDWIKKIEELWKFHYLINGSVFFYNIPIDNIDTNTFTLLDYGFSKDKNSLYFAWKKQSNIKDINNLKFYKSNNTIYIIEPGLIHLYTSWLFEPEYKYINTYSTIENEIKYLNQWMLLLWNNLYIYNKEIKIFEDNTYWINECYLWDKNIIMYHGRSENYYYNINKDYDLYSLISHNCELLEDKYWFIYKWLRIYDNDWIKREQYDSIEEFQSALKIKYKNDNNLIQENFIRVSKYNIDKEFGEKN